MEKAFSLSFEDDYILIRISDGHAVTDGDQRAIWAAVERLMRESQSDRILCLSNQPLRLNMEVSDGYDAAMNMKRVGSGLRLACCFPDFEAEPITDIFRTAARNRGNAVEFFSDKTQALQWLLAP